MSNFQYFKELDGNSSFAWMGVAVSSKCPRFFASGCVVTAETTSRKPEGSAAGPNGIAMNHLRFDSTQVWGPPVPIHFSLKDVDGAP